MWKSLELSETFGVTNTLMFISIDLTLPTRVSVTKYPSSDGEKTDGFYTSHALLSC